MPPKAPPASWPIHILLIGPDQLKALIYHHRMESIVSGSLWCWTYISQGLSQLGQKEVLFTVRRRVATEPEGDYHPEPLHWFKFLHSLAQEGRIVGDFQQTIFQSTTFLDRLDFTMILYCPPTPVSNVPTSYLPEERLHAIPLTAAEAEVASRYGYMRALAHLGISERFFPFPPWIDRDRAPCITMADMKGTVRDIIPFASVFNLSVCKRGSDIVLHVPWRAGEVLKTALAEFEPSHAFALDSCMYNGADSGMLWKNEYTRPVAYSRGSFQSYMNLGFLFFCPEQEKDLWQREEDGYIFFLTDPTWMKIRRAIEESTPLVVPVENSLRFCLEYASQQSQVTGGRARTFLTGRKTHRSILPVPNQILGVPRELLPIAGSSAAPAPSSGRPEYSIPLRYVSRDNCRTCSLTRRLEAKSATSKGNEGSQARPLSPAFERLATTIDKLQSSAEKGCDKCTLLHEGIKAYLPYYNEQSTGMLHFSGNATRLYCTMVVKQGWAPVLEFISCDSVPKDEPCPWLLPEEKPKPCSIMPSDEGVEHVRRWLQSCENNHDSCSNVHPIRMPTRVLDLGTSTDSTGDVRLHESAGETGSYCVLSHCGDSGQSPKTTLLTINDHKAGIQFSRLPPTFQKTILVCRKLGVRYLWIDLLCIIQDDDEDWRNESVSMSKTYGNSRLAIAVSGAGDCTDGCFMSTAPVQNSRRLQWPGVGGEGSYSIYVRPSFEHAAFYDSDPRRANFPVMSRAWVHQERLLSARVLYLGKTELIWKCQEACRCQCGYEFHGAHDKTSAFFSQEELIPAFRDLAT